MPNRAIITILATLIVATVAVLAVFLFYTDARDPGNGTGTPTVGGPFEMVGGDGKPVRSADFAGKYMLVFFGYTNCPDICPAALVTIAEAFETLPKDALDAFRGVFISVDPERDKPAELAEFTSSFHENIVGLTGTRANIDAAVKAYKAFYRIQKSEDPEFYPVDHSSLIYLMGRDGHYITHFSHRTEVDRIVSVLKEQLKK